MGEVLEYEAAGDVPNLSPECLEDIHEILNYRRAIRRAEELLKELPLCERVVRETHKVLLQGVRGQHKSPGEYRKTANWIGPKGCSIETAKFVPISSDRLPDGMKEWERCIHKQDVSDRLVQLGLLHAEFEALHPFLDGNGRIGRMFVPLFMQKFGLIGSPVFYISAFFEAKREEYYERLLAVSRDQDWTGWCAFFLSAVCRQAEENQKKAATILRLYTEKKKQVHESIRSLYASHALDLIFERPIFTSTDFVRSGRMPEPTARRIVACFHNTGIVRTLRKGGGRRPAIYAFAELLNVAEGRKIF